MLRFFRRLLQPAPTFPLDPYRWRHDNRTTGGESFKRSTTRRRAGRRISCGSAGVWRTFDPTRRRSRLRPLWSLSVLGHALLCLNHYVLDRKPMGVCARVLLFPCSLQNSCHVSSRLKPIFSKCCLQNDSNRSGGTPRCLCCGHCADLEVRWKSPGTDHIYRQDCVDFFCARHTEANGNRL